MRQTDFRKEYKLYLSVLKKKKIQLYSESLYGTISSREFYYHIKLSKEQFKTHVNFIRTNIHQEYGDTTGVKHEFYVKQIEKYVLVKLDDESVWESMVIFNNACVLACNWSIMQYYWGVSYRYIVDRFQQGLALSMYFFYLYFTTSMFWTPQRIKDNILPELKVLFGEFSCIYIIYI